MHEYAPQLLGSELSLPHGTKENNSEWTTTATAAAAATTTLGFLLLA